MQFFLTVPHDSAEEPTMASMDPAELAAALAAVEEFNTDLHKSGAFRFAGGLHPPSSAKTVDATSGEPVVVDGPFVEAPEYVGGFWVIEAADQDAALRWATQASKALGGRIEVRAFQDRRTPDRTQIADSRERAHVRGWPTGSSAPVAADAGGSSLASHWAVRALQGHAELRRLRSRYAPEAARTARANVTCVTPLGAEADSIS